MIGIFFYIVFLLCGIIIAALLFENYKRHVILVVGLCLGTLLCAWAPAAVSLIFKRFDKMTNLIAFNSLFIGCLAVAYFKNKKTGFIQKTWRNTDLKEETVMLLCAIPFLIIIIIIFNGHVLLEKVDGSLWGGQSTYGDLSMHVGMITSLAKQGVFPPEYSILSGVKLSYPFLVNSLSSSLYLFGASIRTSIIFPSVVMSFVCFSGFFLLAKKMSRNNKSAIYAMVLFFITGGLGIIYFLGDAQMFQDIFTGFYKTPVNLPDLNLRWVNVICDMMVPQRTTLMGWSVLIVCMFVLYDGMKHKLDNNDPTRGFLKDNKALIVAGVIAGLMPMVHTHSFLALGILCFGALIAGLCVRSIDTKKFATGFIAFFIPVLILATPQLLYWIFTQSGGFVKKHFDWVNNGWPWLKFWVINVGVPFLLIIPAFIWGRKKYLLPFVGAMLIYVIAEVIVFQPNFYDNNKLLLVWYMIMSIIVGDFIVHTIKKIKWKSLRIVVHSILAVVLFSSAALSIIREVHSNGQYMLFSKQQVQAAKAIETYTSTDALILTGMQHLNAPAALAGRNIYVGSNSYLYFHGFDISKRYNNAHQIYEDETNSATLIAQEGIDYIYFSSYERYDYKEFGEFLNDYMRVFDNGEVIIYAVSDRAIQQGMLNK